MFDQVSGALSIVVVAVIAVACFAALTGFVDAGSAMVAA